MSASSKKSTSKLSRLKNRMTVARKTVLKKTNGTPPTSPNPGAYSGEVRETSFLKKRMTLFQMQENIVDVSAMKKLFKTSVSSTISSESSTESRKYTGITSIAVLSQGFFLAASRR
eukprot:CAMPEP_0196205838 /NCGR_PEP_ID=MMETSP0912-20130531/7444_1 /TAXON_ID=49265 /ORGANISM="Thalassiosira rotula, Strain GSO102" /LENGTH=115 /DNA_ID=CAMNT_0041480289 /DNA_START=696 /DNA_END=1039 /DNA_ORIENTATION=+